MRSAAKKRWTAEKNIPGRSKPPLRPYIIFLLQNSSAARCIWWESGRWPHWCQKRPDISSGSKWKGLFYRRGWLCFASFSPLCVHNIWDRSGNRAQSEYRFRLFISESGLRIVDFVGVQPHLIIFFKPVQPLIMGTVPLCYRYAVKSIRSQEFWDPLLRWLLAALEMAQGSWHHPEPFRYIFHTACQEVQQPSICLFQKVPSGLVLLHCIHPVSFGMTLALIRIPIQYSHSVSKSEAVSLIET